MKKLLLLILCVANLTFSQEYISKTSKATCDCLSKKNIDVSTSSKKDIEAAFGLCVLQAYSQNETLYPANEKLDFDNEKALEAFGVKIGLEMFKDCPDVMILMTKKEIENPEEEVQETPDPVITGTFISTKLDGFLYITVKETSGKINQLALINNFDNSFLIVDKVLKPNQKVEVSFFDGELYNAKTNSYINVKVISDIKKL